MALPVTVTISEDDINGFTFTTGDKLVLEAGVTLSNTGQALNASQLIQDRSYVINGNIVTMAADTVSAMLVTGDDAKVRFTDTSTLISSAVGLTVQSAGSVIRIDEGALIRAAGLAVQLQLVDSTFEMFGTIQSVSDTADALSLGSTSNSTISLAGTIVSDPTRYALFAPTVAGVTLTNAGLLQGLVEFSGKESSFHNLADGVIFGNVICSNKFAINQLMQFINDGQVIGDIMVGTGFVDLDLRGGSITGNVFGGAGDNTYTIDKSTPVITELADKGTDLVRANFSYTLAANFENLKLDGSADFRGTGNASENSLSGNVGDNRLFGKAGADLLEGGKGKDRLDGGADVDTASYASAGAGVNVNLATGKGQKSHAAGDNLIGVENLIGSAFNDVLVGSSGANILEGGAGKDRLVGGAGKDTASYEGSDVGVSVNLQSGDARFGEAQGDRLFSIENLLGSDQDDVLKGNAFANVIDGGGGTDTLTGFGGADSFRFSKFGEQTVTDFENGVDLVVLAMPLVSEEFADLNISFSQVSGGTVMKLINLGVQALSVTFEGVEVTDLEESDFLIV